MPTAVTVTSRWAPAFQPTVSAGIAIHSIYPPPDWFQRQADQLRNIAAAIESAKLGKKHSLAKAESADEIKRDSQPTLDDDGLEKLAVPYVEANFAVPTRQEPHTLSLPVLVEIIQKIVQIEGPIHEDEVVNRFKALWGFARAGSRIQGTVRMGIGSMMSTGQYTNEDGFLSVNGATVVVRNRENVSSPDLRKPERIAPAELRAGILAVIDLGHGAAAKEIPTAVARMLGFKNTSQQLRYAVEGQIHKLAKNNSIIEANGLFKRA